MMHFIVDGILILLSIILTSQQSIGAIPVQVVVPQGIESVNGSDVNMNCTSPLVDSGDGVMVCSSGCSTLLDGISPTIDISTSDWASQLVTVRRTEHDIPPYTRVLLTFRFDTAVTATKIELDLFLCPQWKIGAPLINVYANVESNLTFSYPNNLPFTTIEPSESSCDSLSTVTITLVGDALSKSSFLTLHILVSQFRDAEWAHIGEVRFLDADIPLNPGLCNGNVVTPATSPAPTTSDTSTSTMSSNMATNYYNTFTTSYASTPTTTTTSTVTKTDNLATPQVVLIAITVGLALLALLVVPVVGYYFINKHYCSRIHQKEVQNSDHGTVGITEDVPSNAEGNNIYHPSPNVGEAEVCNPVYSVHIRPVVSRADGVYSEVGRNKMCVKNSTQMTVTTIGEESTADVTATTNKTSEMELAGYEIVQLGGEQSCILPNAYNLTKSEEEKASVTGTDSEASEVIESVGYATVQHGDKKSYTNELTKIPEGKDDITGTPRKAREVIESAAYATVQRGDKQSYTHPNAPDLIGVPKGKDSVKPIHLQSHVQERQPTKELPHTVEGERDDLQMCSYSVVQVKELPMVPPKSSDLERYLEKGSGLNENITFYSEAINPGDFTSNKMESGENDPEMLAPIYTVPTIHSESYQEPAHVTCDNITEKRVLGTGQFGQIVLAETNGLSLKTMGLSKTDNRERSIIVAVKKMKAHPSQKQQEAFDREIKFMSQLRHPSVLRLLGICYQDPAFIMMEYTEEGDLNQFLQKFSEIMTVPASDTQIATSTIVYMASQIASAMQYLAELNFVHRDLATRNCFIGKNCSIKLGELSMNRNLYKSNYYRIHGSKLLPIRWMATECFSGRFSEKSDVWAFGVAMWELFTLAEDVPYPHLSDEEVIHNALKREYRHFPSRPAACPQPVYEIMEQCWVVNLQKRALFQQLHKMLQMQL